ncbi:phage holin family protein [Falsiroseomonas sp. CW058]|uniref:phage holin family protein n=1 Tax=Falsiroseomonas sp. CW058 TaxID=3388664 RepID=UPI003D31F2BC
MPSDYGRSLPELFGDLVNQLSTLFRKEIQLARAEMGEKVNETTAALPGLAIGGVLLLGALIMLLHALAALLIRLFDLAPGWGYLITGLIAALGGYLLLKGALAKLKMSNLMPERTAHQLSRDAQVAKEQVR